MVKKMDNYSKRMSDRRFEKFDRMIEPNNNDKKLTVIVTIGVIISLILMASSLITESQKPAALKYTKGLNISYDAKSSMYYIDYTNPLNDTSSMIVNVQVPYASEMITVYNTQTSKFPANISYRPSNTDIIHTVAVNLIKPNGNYTYFLTNIPIEEDRLYEGLYKYTEPIQSLIQ